MDSTDQGNRELSALARFCNFLKGDSALWPGVAFTLLIVAGMIVLLDSEDCASKLPGRIHTSPVTTFLLLL